MNSYSTLAVVLIVWSQLSGQVCCSLAGTVDNGGGSNSNQWNTHWPSPFGPSVGFRWIAGLGTVHTFNKNFPVEYGLSTRAFIEISHTIREKNVVYIHLDYNRLQIQESLSFERSSSMVNQFAFSAGFRSLLKGRRGYIAGELSLPDTPRYTNRKFPFKSGAVPSLSLAWSQRIRSPWFVSNPSLLANNTLSITGRKNLALQDNIYIDDQYVIHVSSILERIPALFLVPYINGRLDKLLVPLSPWEQESPSRWLGTISAGIDITPAHDRWNWIHLRFSIPIIFWASEIGFPDGTQPSAKLSLDITLNNALSRQE